MSKLLKKHRSFPSFMPLQIDESLQNTQTQSILSYLQSQNSNLKNNRNHNFSYSQINEKVNTANETKKTSRLTKNQKLLQTYSNLKQQNTRKQTQIQTQKLRNHNLLIKQKIIKLTKAKQLHDFIYQKNNFTTYQQTQPKQDFYWKKGIFIERKSKPGIMQTICWNCKKKLFTETQVKSSEVSLVQVKEDSSYFLEKITKNQQPINSPIYETQKQNSSSQCSLHLKDKEKLIKINLANRLGPQNWGQGSRPLDPNIISQFTSRLQKPNTVDLGKENSNFFNVQVKISHKLNENQEEKTKSQRLLYKNHKAKSINNDDLKILRFEHQNQILETQNILLEKRISEKLNEETQLLQKLNQLIKKIQSLKKYQLSVQKLKNSSLQTNSSPQILCSQIPHQKTISSLSSQIPDQRLKKCPYKQKQQLIQNQMQVSNQSPNFFKKKQRSYLILDSSQKNHIKKFPQKQKIKKSSIQTDNRKKIDQIHDKTSAFKYWIDQTPRVNKNKSTNQFSASYFDSNQFSVSNFDSRLIPTQTNQQKLSQLQELFQNQLKNYFKFEKKSLPFSKKKDQNLLHRHKSHENLHSGNLDFYKNDQSDSVVRNKEQCVIEKQKSKQKLKVLSQQIKILRQKVRNG